MKFALLGAIAAVILTCAASEPRILDKAQVLRIAMDYAHEKKWDVINVWKDMPDFNEASREWRVFINTKQNGGPMIVYVDDKTKNVRFARGE